MSAHAVPSGTTTAPTTTGLRSALRADASEQAYLMLRIAFTVAPILFGVDKFFNVMVDWTQYLAPWINSIIPGDAHDAMHLVGVIEIVAGLAVAIRPRYRGAAGRGLAVRHHHQPADLLGLLRRRPARLRADDRRADPHPSGLGP